jgi:hypothetical protein
LLVEGLKSILIWEIFNDGQLEKIRKCAFDECRSLRFINNTGF